VTLFVERRIPQSLRRKFKILRVGKPGKDLGLDDQRNFLVCSERNDWKTDDKRAKRLRNIFRSAIVRICLALLRKKFEAALKISTRPTITSTSGVGATLGLSLSHDSARALSRAKSEKRKSVDFKWLQKTDVLGALKEIKNVAMPQDEQDEKAEILVAKFEETRKVDDEPALETVMEEGEVLIEEDPVMVHSKNLLKAVVRDIIKNKKMGITREDSTLDGENPREQ